MAKAEPQRGRESNKKRVCDRTEEMDLKRVFFLLCFSRLQSRGDSAESIHIDQYNRTGEDVTLLCDKVKPYGPNCSTVTWSHNNRDPNTFLVLEGQIKNIPRSTRLTLNPDCSLSIKNITEGDYGRYLCGPWNSQARTYKSYTYIYLSVLSVSVAQPSLDQTPTGHVTLQCTLWRHLSRPSCGPHSLLWLENGTVLSGEGVTQKNCESTLTVELQSPQIRTFTCQYQLNGRVQVSADYSLRGDTDPSKPEPLSVYVIPAAVVRGLVLLGVTVVLFFKIKSKKKTAEATEETEGDPPAADATTDPENGLTYASIDHHKPKAKLQVKEEDAVTYSEVNLQNTAKSDHGAIYSRVKCTAQD